MTSRPSPQFTAYCHLLVQERYTVLITIICELYMPLQAAGAAFIGGRGIMEACVAERFLLIPGEKGIFFISGTHGCNSAYHAMGSDAHDSMIIMQAFL